MCTEAMQKSIVQVQCTHYTLYSLKAPLPACTLVLPHLCLEVVEAVDDATVPAPVFELAHALDLLVAGRKPWQLELHSESTEVVVC